MTKKTKPGTVGALLDALAKYDRDVICEGYSSDESMLPFSGITLGRDGKSLSINFEPPPRTRFRVTCERQITVAREVKGKLQYNVEWEPDVFIDHGYSPSDVMPDPKTTRNVKVVALSRSRS